jgi:hypothetical protein
MLNSKKKKKVKISTFDFKVMVGIEKKFYVMKS